MRGQVVGPFGSALLYHIFFSFFNLLLALSMYLFVDN